jgi:hypothetical protein
MRVGTARWVAGCAAAASVVLIIAGLALAYADRHRVPASLLVWNFPDVFGQVVNLAVPVVGFVLVSRRPANRIGWVFLVAGLGLGLGFFAAQYGEHALVAAPGTLPAGRAAGWLSNWIWVIPFAMLAFLFLLFPTGRLLSPRWRLAAWFLSGVFVLTAVGALVSATRYWSDPFAGRAQNSSVLVALFLLVLAALIVSVTAVVVRYVRSAGEERLQLKWFAAAAVLLVATFIVSSVTSSALASVANNLAFLVPVGGHRHRGAEVPAV